MNDLSADKIINPREFTSDGTAYTVTGESTSTLIFIHGVGMNADVWLGQTEHFAKEYKIISYDFLGHGKSPMPSEDPILDEYVEQLYCLCNELQLASFSLVGHSMGALIGVAFALKYPSKINALIPINIVYNRTEKAQSRVLKRAEQVIASSEVGGIKQTLERWFSDKNSPKEKMKIAKIQQWLSVVSPYGYGRAYRLFALSDKVFMNKLSQLQMSVLYLTGDDDSNSTPEMSKKMAELTPRGEFYSIAKEAHMMAYIATEKTNKILGYFLNKHGKK